MDYYKIYLSSQDNWPYSLDFMGQFFLIIGMVAVIGLMAYLSVRLMSASRTGGKFGASRNLQIIETVGVGIQANVQLIRSCDRYFMLGVTKEHVTLLTEIDKDSVKVSDGKMLLENNPFDKVLKRFIKKDIDNNE